jgi:hypothetical protein
MRIANGFISDALIQTENSRRTVASHADIIMQKTNLGGCLGGHLAPMIAIGRRAWTPEGRASAIGRAAMAAGGEVEWACLVCKLNIRVFGEVLRGLTVRVLAG